jgi:hypothetical protein
MVITMKYEEILQALAPCGLDCNRCADYQGGEIRRLSQNLLQLLGGYQRVARMKEKNSPLFKNYHHFKEILDSLAGGPCGGCRSHNNRCFIECRAKACPAEKQVDFCFQCAHYPCDSQFTGALRERWLLRNNRMKEIGVEEFYKEQLNIPRY